MLNVPLSILLLFPALSMTAAEAPSGGGKELCAAFDAYNVTVKSGDVDKILALRTSHMQKEIRRQIKNKKNLDYFVLIGRAQVPDSYEIMHINWTKEGKGAEVFSLLRLPAMKEVERPKAVSIEALITFGREGGKWKLDSILPLGDPARVKRPKDLVYDESAADTSVDSASVAGRIVKLEFKADHTLVMVRVMDEEVAVFLPKKEILEEAGVDFQAVAPWKMREFTGYPHKKDKLKFFATGDNPIE